MAQAMLADLQESAPELSPEEESPSQSDPEPDQSEASEADSAPEEVEAPAEDEPKPDEQEADAVEEAADELPDELKDASDSAKNRFQKLSNDLRDAETRIREELEPKLAEMEPKAQIWDDFRSYTRADANQVTQMADYLSAMNTGDFDKAIELLESSRAQLYAAAGREAPGVDLLTDFPDLSQAVNEYRVTREHALELAKARRTQEQMRQQTEQQETQQQTQQQYVQAAQQAQVEINQMSEEWAKSDIDWDAKEKMLLEEIPDIRDNYPPSEWRAELERRYNTINRLSRGVKPKPTEPQPARAATNAAIETAEDSMLGAIVGSLSKA